MTFSDGQYLQTVNPHTDILQQIAINYLTSYNNHVINQYSILETMHHIKCNWYSDTAYQGQSSIKR